jgi:hypothetical protein
MPQSGTWSNSDTGSKATLGVMQSSGQAWDCAVGSSQDQGTYTMSLTPGTGTSAGSGYIYQMATGMITATLPAVSGSGASGVVNLVAKF